VITGLTVKESGLGDIHKKPQGFQSQPRVNYIERNKQMLGHMREPSAKVRVEQIQLTDQKKLVRNKTVTAIFNKENAQPNNTNLVMSASKGVNPFF